MKKALSICLIFCIMLSVLLPVGAVESESLGEGNGTVYYVSPNGSDSNSGTESRPWKTLAKAAQTLMAGDTAVFEDGIYTETGYTTFTNSGTAENPITIKARNKHKAVIYYDETLRREKLKIIDRSYINVRDLCITQQSISEEGVDSYPTTDILIKLQNSHHCEITGNRIYYAYEEGIKAYLSSYLLVEDNEIFYTTHEGMDFFAVAESVIRGNVVREFQRDAYMFKGNTCNTLVYNNIAYNNEVTTTGTGFDIGGGSDGTSPICTVKNVGYENLNSVFYNNIVYSADMGGDPTIQTGIAFLGAKDCHCYNNVVVGTTYGIQFTMPKNTEWKWYPNTENPVIKNNIIANVLYAYRDNSSPVSGLSSPVNVTRDYNLYYNVTYDSSRYPFSAETNSIVLDEADDITLEDIFAGEVTAWDPETGSLNDWRLKTGSPAEGKGTPLPETIPGFAGFDEAAIRAVDSTYVKSKDYAGYSYDTTRVITLDLVDYSGEPRKLPWDMGVFNSEEIFTVESLNWKTQNGAGTEVPTTNGILASAQICKRVEDENATAIFAFKSADGKLLACKIVSLADLEYGTQEVTVGMQLPGEGVSTTGTLTAYIWNINKIQPITLAQLFTFNS